MSTPAQRREKILRDFAMAMSNLDAGLFGIAANAKEAIAAADAIPDAPAIDQSLTGVYQVSAIASKPVPSRAELIELMRKAWTADSQHYTNATQMARVLDALVKAGAVR